MVHSSIHSFIHSSIHPFIYTFIHPFLSSLKPLDIQFMKELHHLVNIIPVIAKSDTLTPSEIKKLKTRVLPNVLFVMCFYLATLYPFVHSFIHLSSTSIHSAFLVSIHLPFIHSFIYLLIFLSIHSLINPFSHSYFSYVYTYKYTIE